MLTITQARLQEAIESVMPAVESSGNNWYQRFIKLEWSPEEGMTALASSGFFTIRHRLSEDIDVDEAGGLCVNGEAMHKLTRSVPGDTLEISTRKREDADVEDYSAGAAAYMPGEPIPTLYALDIVGDKGDELQIFGAGPDRYPSVMLMEADEDAFQMSAGDIETLVGRIEYASTEMRGRPGLRCVEIAYNEESDVTEFACSDRHRIACYRLPGSIGTEDNMLQGLVPVGAFRAVAKLADDSDEMVSITLDDNQVSFDMADTLITSGLMNANFPEWRPRVRHDDPDVALVVDRKQLIDRLGLYGVAAKMRRDRLNVTMTAKSISVAADSQLARVSGSVDGVGGEGEGHVGFAVKAQLFQDALSHLKSDQVTIRAWADEEGGQVARQPIELAAAGEDANVFYCVLPINKRE